jgi:hypothetical protein
MTNDETSDLVDLAEDIMSEGIEVYFRKSDGVKLFAAVLAANVTTWFVVVGVATATRVKLRKMQIEKEAQEQESEKTKKK